MARLCVKHDVTLCSDEVWGECVLEPEATPFIGMGALCAEVEGLRERLIVISSPSKVFNVACTDIAYAEIPGEGAAPGVHPRWCRQGRGDAVRLRGTHGSLPLRVDSFSNLRNSSVE